MTQEQFNQRLEQAIAQELGPNATSEQRTQWIQTLLNHVEELKEAVE